MRLIDADALREKFKNVDANGINLELDGYALKCIDDAPTIERKKGKWIDMGDFEQCSVCLGTRLKEVQTFYGKAIWIKTDFCPNCGADMRGEI